MTVKTLISLIYIYPEFNYDENFMKKNLITSILLFVIIPSLLFAQHPGKRWAELYDDNGKTVYMDTTSIRLLDNQLSVWSLVQHSEPIAKEHVDGLVSKIKTQYLINTLTERYSLIGALFYDNRGRIIGESSTSRFAGGSQKVTTPVSDNDLVGMLMESAKNYTQYGRLDFSRSDFDLSSDYEDTLPDDEVEDYSNQVEEDNTKNDSEEDDGISFEDDDEDTTVAPEEEDEGYSDVSDDNNSSSNTETYVSSRESIAGGTIFTDGNLFCFQLSSWRSKSTAQREVSRLIRQGHKAFLTEAYIPKKGGTWYRVRIGYFNSFQEAKNYKRTVR